MRFFRIGFALLLAATVSQCALEHPNQRGDATADVTDIGQTDRLDVSDGSDAVVDAGPCGAATQRCCTAPAGGQDAGTRGCNAGLACTGGVCSPCAAGSAECGGVCVPTNTVQNCGACGNACTVGQGCVTPDAGMARCETVCPSGQTNCGGVCVSTVTDPANCGTCGTRCEFANATAMCASGTCALGSCLSGFENCDGMASNGCEANVRTDATNCGTCGTTCRFDHGAATCDRGVCVLGTCDAGFGDCDGNPGNGCETNINTSPANCNRCGLACPMMGGAPACRMGVCGTSTCAVGRGDCDSMTGNGCETDLLTTATNCGTCGNSCSFPNATAVCTAGACALGTCATGFANCDGMAGNGCETNLRTDVGNCGMCARACSFANGAATCAAGTCSLTSCNAGFANCDGNAVNGCEVDTRSNVGNCGACTNACSFDHGVAMCAGSACGLASCEAGFGNCDGNATNGCEVNTQTTVAHCGACNRLCVLANATPGCASSVCTVAACNSGFGNCDGNPANGCEVNTNTSVTNCGTCGNSCSLANATPTCTGGGCRIASCNANFFDCDGNPANGCEVDLRTTSNCGTCGRVCGTSEVCLSGACALVCPGTQVACSGSCVFTDRDTSHCGGCGRACSAANGVPSCASSACSIACNTGFGNCDGMIANGCEASTRTVTNCGACGTACTRANATATCSTGACAIATCNAGFANCDGIDSNGCEVTLRTTTNCSGCGDVCGSTNATAVCTTGTTPACDLTCATGFADCNASAADGCEVNVRTLTNCATCGTACTRANATPICTTGACRISTCNTNFGNCDATDSNGCETPLLTTNANCGACGTSCATNTGTTTNTCTAGTCVPVCASGFASCDTNPVNGCEVDTRVNSSNCGGCGIICQTNANTTTNACTGSTCHPTCATGFADCDGNPNNGCEASLNSASNCGTCGTVCGSGFSCTASGATFACSSVCGDPGQGCCGSMVCRGGSACSSGLCCIPPLVNCGGACVNTATSGTNCGACGTTCTTPTGTTSNTCTGGACVPVCNSSFGDCDSSRTNGCETNLTSSAANCNACGTACNTNAGTTSNACSSRVCVPVCASNFGNCDSNPNNGCETDTRTSNANCGGCGTACATNTGTPTNTCTASVCVPVCASGFASCDGNPNNGCETPTSANNLNCGGCGIACTTNAGTSANTCASGACVPVCVGSFANCDSNAANGCETDTSSSVTHCGMCGMGCTAGDVCMSGTCTTPPP